MSAGFHFDAWGKEAGPNGAALLDAVQAFLARFVVYPDPEALVAHTLWIGHTWFMDRWDSTPRLAFLSAEPGSGKSRALEVTDPLVPRAVHAVNTTPAYLFRRVSDPSGAPTLLYDEIDTVFGPKAKDNEDIRGMLNAGHRRGATAGRCVVRGNRVFTEDLPAYCAVALAGLGHLPDTILTRSIVVRMRRRGPSERVEPWRSRINGPEGEALGLLLSEWAEANRDEIVWPQIPDEIQDRNADKWEALLAVADLAGGHWPAVAREAAIRMVNSGSEREASLGVQLLTDLRQVFGSETKLSTATALERLCALEESPWGDLRGRPLDSRRLSRILRDYGVRSVKDRYPEGSLHGYRAEDLADPWSRYLSAPENPEQAEQSEPTPTEVPDVPNVPDFPRRDGDCPHGYDIASGQVALCSECLANPQAKSSSHLRAVSN